MSVSVCLSLCVCLSVRSHLKNHASKLHEIFCNILPVHGSVFSDGNAIRYTLPVLWMTSCFHILRHMARDVCRNDVGAVLQQVVKISNVPTLSLCTTAASGAPRAKCDVYD